MGLQLHNLSSPAGLSAPTLSNFTSSHAGLVSKHVNGFQFRLKRFIDVLLGIFCIILLSPALLLVALAVGLSSPGPIIYKSLRIGHHQQPFYMYKFRSMWDETHHLRDQLAEHHNIDQNGLFKLQNDSRITPIGGFLRKYSLDELPQLFNVLKGDMSLVGPRPFIPEESALFESPFTARFMVLPGMTGPWQVNGRSHLPFSDLCQLELNYVNRWTLWEDLFILLKTIPAVLMQHGAY